MKEETQKLETELEAPGERLERVKKSMQAAPKQRETTTVNQHTWGFHLTAQGPTLRRFTAGTGSLSGPSRSPSQTEEDSAQSNWRHLKHLDPDSLVNSDGESGENLSYRLPGGGDQVQSQNSDKDRTCRHQDEAKFLTEISSSSFNVNGEEAVLKSRE